MKQTRTRKTRFSREIGPAISAACESENSSEEALQNCSFTRRLSTSVFIASWKWDQRRGRSVLLLLRTMWRLQLSMPEVMLRLSLPLLPMIPKRMGRAPLLREVEVVPGNRNLRRSQRKFPQGEEGVAPGKMLRRRPRYQRKPQPKPARLRPSQLPREAVAGRPELSEQRAGPDYMIIIHTHHALLIQSL